MDAKPKETGLGRPDGLASVPGLFANEITSLPYINNLNCQLINFGLV